MECPAGTVMSRLYRGRKMLQKQLADYGSVPETQQTEPASEDKVEDKVVDFETFRRKKQEGGAA